jgi:hypothetical protein
VTGIEEITTGGRTGVTIVGTSANQVMDFSTMVLDGIGLFDAGAGNDTVTGGTGNDRLTGGAGADIFRLTAQITFIVIGGGTGAFIIGETNGDGTPDFQIELIGTGLGPFTEADFIL